MHEDDLKEMKCVEEILEKDLRAELKKVKDAGTFAPGQTKTLNEAVDLMLKMKEYEEWLEGQGMSDYSQREASRMTYDNSPGGSSYRRGRSSVTGQYVSRRGGYPVAYGNNMSGHSTRDRMISRLEDMMGEAKNEYEAQMIVDAINYIQNSER